MNNNENTNELLDLGSTPIDDDFDPFETETEVLVDTSTTEDTSAQQTQTAEPIKTETKDAQSADLSEKPPVFEYAGATENIDDTSKTFDELRIEKSTDFPELEDGKRVSWTVEYGKITKTVSDPKGMSIGKMKSDIEASKEFTDNLKKAKDKNPSCKIKPRVTAQSKGTLTSYRGVFTNMDDVTATDKVISIIPARDGKVYEIRKTEMGRFITPINGCDMLSEVMAGFFPALPRIPMETVLQIVSFFRHYMRNGSNQEALVNIYWDKKYEQFIIDAPEQIVTPVSVNSKTNDDYANERYIHFMDIHSHNSMRAFFSFVDDNDEKATRLYTVIGNLHEYFPDIKTRISNGGKFLDIDPLGVFELTECLFPMNWTENVSFRKQHGDDDKNLFMRYIGGDDK